MPKAKKDVFLIGIAGSQGFSNLSPGAKASIIKADYIYLSKRFLDAFSKNFKDITGKIYVFEKDIESQVHAALLKQGIKVFIVSGDPGYFGLLKVFSRLEKDLALEVIPDLSSVSLAFSKLSLSWEDAFVISAQGRYPVKELYSSLSYPKVAVLTSPQFPPEKLLSFYFSFKDRRREIHVFSNLAAQNEKHEIFKTAFSNKSLDPLSVAIILQRDQLSHEKLNSNWPKFVSGKELDETFLVTKNNMFTKREVRDLVLSKLNLGFPSILFDLGAGSGTLSIAAKLKYPYLTVFAVEKNPEMFKILRRNVRAFDAKIMTIFGDANSAIKNLPDPDSVFIGGGKIELLQNVLELKANKRIVATYSSLERALQASKYLKNLVQVQVNTAETLGNTLFFRGQNPVFIAWDDV